MPKKGRKSSTTKDEEVVERIVDHVSYDDEETYEYCVKWKGYGAEHNTWHLEHDLQGCKKLIARYWVEKKKQDEEKDDVWDEVERLKSMISSLQQRQNQENQHLPRKKPKTAGRSQDKEEAFEAPVSESDSDDDVAPSPPPPKSELTDRVRGYRSSEEIEHDRMLLQALPPGELAKFSNAKIHGKQVHSKCIYSKSMTHPCANKRLMRTDDDDNDDDGAPFYAFADATWVHMSHIKNPMIRDKDGKEAVRILKKNFGMCGSCISHTERDHYINLLKPSQSCCMCKKNSSGLKKDAISHVAICSECMKARQRDGGRQFILRCLNPLFTIFEDIPFRLIKERYVRDGGNKRFADQVLQFEKDGYVAMIIIERDENQHAERDKKEEKNKMVEQVSGMITSMMKLQNVKKNIHKIKCWFIRYNPYAKYRINSDHEETKVMHDYSEQMRLMILREWIVWYVFNIAEVRNCMFSYMWYNYSQARKAYPFKMAPQEKKKYPGKNILYEAPYCPGKSDWAYSIDPHDVIKTNVHRGRSAAEEFVHMNTHKIDVNSIKHTWSKENGQTSTSTMFPPEIAARVQNALHTHS